MRLNENSYIDSPAKPVHHALASYENLSTAAGNVGGTTIVCAGLALEPSYVGMFVKVLDGGAAGQLRGILTHVGNTITVDAAFTNPAGAAQQIIAGVRFVIISTLNLASIVGAIAADLAVPGVDAVANVLERDVIGNKGDTALNTAGTASIMNLLRFIISSGIGLQAIFNLVNAIFTTYETGGTLAATGGVDDVYRVDPPIGIFKPLCVKIDTTNMQAGDQITINIYERIIAGGALILSDQVAFAGVQAIPLKTIDLDPNRFGVQVTLQQTAGVNRDYDWSAAYEV